ncbi:MAG TPA: 4'-phosphopantetheinyl transferase superfamily protein [Vicinamibacterales bacterium]
MPAAAGPDYVTTLAQDERDAAARFHFESDRRRYVAAHLALRNVLAELTGRPPSSLRFGRTEHGKPFLLESDLHFSLSHSHDFIAIAVAHAPVGIDVERIRPEVETSEIASRYFRPDEVQWIANQRQRDLAFFQLWTLKEAIIKADGRGLSLPLDEVCVDLAALSSPGPIRCSAGGAEWLARPLEAPAGYCAHVAFREAARPSPTAS